MHYYLLNPMLKNAHPAVSQLQERRNVNDQRKENSQNFRGEKLMLRGVSVDSELLENTDNRNKSLIK